MEYLGNPPFPPSNAIDNGAPTNFAVPTALHGGSQRQQLALESGDTDLIQQDDNVKQQEHSVVDNENGEQVVWRPY
jgi:hypothetical protein